MHDELSDVFAAFSRERKYLIPILQKVQEKLGYLPEEAISEVARFLRLSKNEVFGVASFYAQFRFERQGEYGVKVCLGTACHVRGGGRIMDTVKQGIGIEPGETSEDYKFSLERVACFGSCALAPVMVVDKTVYGRMTTAKARQVLAKYQEEIEDNG
ncbi:NADH-quinone oxidoreductase subunit NuoE [Bacteroidota bacterium]